MNAQKLTREQEIELAYAQLKKEQKAEKDKVWDQAEQKQKGDTGSLLDLALS